MYSSNGQQEVVYEYAGQSCLVQRRQANTLEPAMDL